MRCFSIPTQVAISSPLCVFCCWCQLENLWLESISLWLLKNVPVVNREASGISINARRLRRSQCAPGHLARCWQDFFPSNELHFLYAAFSSPLPLWEWTAYEISFYLLLLLSRVNAGVCFYALIWKWGKTQVSQVKNGGRWVQTLEKTAVASSFLENGLRAASSVCILLLNWTFRLLACFGKLVFCFVF